MSGEWDDDWVHYKLAGYAERVMERSPTNALHLAFAAKLLRLSEALKALTWEFSGDCGEGDADAALRAMLEPADELNAAIELANASAKQLRDALERANSGASRLKAS